MNKRYTSSTLMARVMQKSKPYLFLLPALFFIVMFTYYPFVETIINSFFKLNNKAQRVNFVGLKNYLQVFKAKNFNNSLYNSIRFTLMTVPFNISISLILALLAEKRRRFSRMYEVMFSLPMAISMSATCMIFKLLLNNSIGLFNYSLGLDIKWFFDKNTALWGIAIITVWQNIGYEFLYLSAALRNVPQDVLEAATVDGANWIHRTLRIVFPLITPTVFYLFCLDLIGGMMMSGPVMVLTNGGPRNSTETLVYHMYSKTVSGTNMGYGYAISIVIFLIVFLLMLLSFKAEKKGVYYE